LPIGRKSSIVNRKSAVAVNLHCRQKPTAQKPCRGYLSSPCNLSPIPLCLSLLSVVSVLWLFCLSPTAYLRPTSFSRKPRWLEATLPYSVRYFRDGGNGEGNTATTLFVVASPLGSAGCWLQRPIVVTPHPAAADSARPRGNGFPITLYQVSYEPISMGYPPPIRDRGGASGKLSF
jgi:hypothetical protein